MIPTISHSPARIRTCWSALIPPKWMDRSSISSTDIGHLHVLDLAGVRVEATPEQPLADWSQLLADPAGVHRDREQEQDRAHDQRHELRREADRALDEPGQAEPDPAQG